MCRSSHILRYLRFPIATRQTLQKIMGSRERWIWKKKGITKKKIKTVFKTIPFLIWVDRGEFYGRESLCVMTNMVHSKYIVPPVLVARCMKMICVTTKLVRFFIYSSNNSDTFWLGVFEEIATSTLQTCFSSSFSVFFQIFPFFVSLCVFIDVNFPTYLKLHVVFFSPYIHKKHDFMTLFSGLRNFWRCVSKIIIFLNIVKNTSRITIHPQRD